MWLEQGRDGAPGAALPPVFLSHGLTLRYLDIKTLPIHLPQELPGLLGLVDVTCVQGSRVPSCFAERLVELELDDEADKVPGGLHGDRLC